jgi:hypothetical protein
LVNFDHCPFITHERATQLFYGTTSSWYDGRRTLHLRFSMTDTNPPQEREAKNQDAGPSRYQRLRPFGSDEEAEAEALSSKTWNFLTREEPDASRRAALWLIGSQIGAGYDSAFTHGVSAEGARAADTWIKSMCRSRSSHQP